MVRPEEGDPSYKHWIGWRTSWPGVACARMRAQAEQVLREEVAAVCAQVLADAGVYKQDEAGLAGMKRFLATLGYQA